MTRMYICKFCKKEDYFLSELMAHISRNHFNKVVIIKEIENLTKLNNDFKASAKLSQICKCRHDWNMHNVLDGEACHSMDCKCSKFEPTS